MQLKDDLIVTDHQQTTGQITGTTYVKSGGILIARGQLAGGLVIEAGGKAVVHGQVARNVVNHGTLELFGQVAGKVIGNQPINQVKSEQIVGNDLEVPFRGTSKSWSSNG
ncbi:hypothetical protein TU86_14965 [Pseudomonas weihenstephanensis]|uniref:Uncharacterized protein n=1 Tax=Pseudomonas weihenstephanensis TaxID=1608994 RepID=A0A0J6IM71_9PSED|nr:hypothetical protein [Pseudomonas weihenstephanensis]KMN13353.1 hypothetical protein TU86_14965 [Pseudomonas weihenstephanensis]